VLNQLDPTGDMFRGRFYREHCRYDPDLGVYAKDVCDVLRMRQRMIRYNDDDDDDVGEGYGMDGYGYDEAAYHDEQRNNHGMNLFSSLYANNNNSSNSTSCDVRRVVLVDNNPLSFLPNPSNGILVSSFYDDPKDDTLEAVMELLHELDESDDVRPILDDRFGLRDALDDVTKGAAAIRW
jgi:TFIIF-interacting CTD phosphatase-like protein